jgi:hypothetical protein
VPVRRETGPSFCSRTHIESNYRVFVPPPRRLSFKPGLLLFPWQWLPLRVLGTNHGPNKSESAGIVDVLLIRKDHRRLLKDLKRGDLFEIILLQIKGGKAPWPSREDIRRLRIVQAHYKARTILLARWEKGKTPDVYELKRAFRTQAASKDAWKLLPSLQQLLQG